MKILHLNPSSHLGGAEWVLHDLVTHLDRTRFRPLVVVPKSGLLVERLRAAGIEVRLLSALAPLLRLGRHSRPWQYACSLPALTQAVGGLLQLARLIREEGIAIVHAHGLKMHLLTGMLGVCLPIPIIWHLHDFVSRRKFYRLFMLLAKVSPSVIIANSAAVAADLAALDKVVIVHNGIDLQAFSPRWVKNRDDGLLHVGLIGVLTPWKGHDVFLEAARIVHQRARHVQFWIVGDEIYDTDGHLGYRRQLEQRVKSYGLQAQVRFTGFCPDVAQMIQMMDVIVHASVEPEPFGRVLIEAMACGKPVIAAGAGGVLEIVEPGVTGLLVPPGNAGQLAEAMLRLINDESERQRLGLAGRRRVEQRFSLTQQVRRIEAIYESLRQASGITARRTGGDPSSGV